jgi:hypothetical protein
MGQFWSYGAAAGGIVGFTLARRETLEISDKTRPRLIRLTAIGALVGFALGLTVDVIRYLMHV